jgi:PAS domain-containing protein
MSKVRHASEAAPAWGAPIDLALADLYARSAAMGLVDARHAGAMSPDAPGLSRLLKSLQQHGIGGDGVRTLAPLLQARKATPDAETERALAQGLQRLAEALEDSAAPVAEWPAMRAVFGDELLGELLGVSPASLRRYAGQERATPQEVAERLHWLALVVADLAGAYNDFGMRRWFDRPRSQLGGKSPRQVLGRRWGVDGEGAVRVRTLASVLRGANPLAA